MSAQDVADAAAQNSELLTDRSFLATGVALLIYDYLITISQEVEFIWTSKALGSVIIFFVNRFVMLGLAVSYILNTPAWSSVVEVITILLDIFFVASAVMWGVISGLRIYTILRRCWRLSSATALLGIVPAVTNIVLFSSQHLMFQDGIYSMTPTLSTSTQFKLEIATRTCAIISDTSVILTSWLAIYGVVNYSYNKRIKTSLAQSLVRDGTMYFVVLLALNIASMVLFVRKVSQCVPLLIAPLTSIMISRLMLNVRQVRFEMHDSIAFVEQSNQKSHPFQGQSIITTMVFGANSIANRSQAVPGQASARFGELEASAAARYGDEGWYEDDEALSENGDELV